MESSLSGRHDLDLRAVSVRPTYGAREHRRWDRLVATHHYLSFQALSGKGLRDVATLGSTWIALLGWQAAALKLTARDRWIGWSRPQQQRRRHLVPRLEVCAYLPSDPNIEYLPDLRCYADHRSHVSVKVDAVPVDSGLKLRSKRS